MCTIGPPLLEVLCELTDVINNLHFPPKCSCGWKWALSVVLIRSVYMGCCHVVKSGASRVRLSRFESQLPDMLSTSGQDAFSRTSFLLALNGITMVPILQGS